jgi:hypothetical protein
MWWLNKILSLERGERLDDKLLGRINELERLLESLLERQNAEMKQELDRRNSKRLKELERQNAEMKQELERQNFERLKELDRMSERHKEQQHAIPSSYDGRNGVAGG